MPIQRAEDANGNGRLDEGEDWDSDGHLDVVESEQKLADGTTTFTDLDGDGIRDGDNLDNVFVALWRGETFPAVNLGGIAILAAFAGIAGGGGLTNIPISNYTRDQGWGMGKHVGAIPSIIGGQNLSLSHVGMVFEINEQSIARFRRWYRHVLRNQLVVWTPACFLGVALPSMLSVQFLRRGTVVNGWATAVMTAEGVQKHVNQAWGELWGLSMWYMMLFCGFLVLAPSAASMGDGVVRRWVDVFWTSSSAAQVGPQADQICLFRRAGRIHDLGRNLDDVWQSARLVQGGGQLHEFCLGNQLLAYAGDQHDPAAAGAAAGLVRADRISLGRRLLFRSGRDYRLELFVADLMPRDTEPVGAVRRRARSAWGARRA